MASYPLGPWFSQPADPASHYTTGLQIGVRIGAEQAAQQYQQQQINRAIQQDEFERQYKMAVLNLKVEETVRKQRAVADFQQRVQAGENPLAALMQVGPAMGESAAGIARAQQMAESAAQRKAQAEASLGLRKQEFETREARLEREASARQAAAANREKRLLQAESRRASDAATKRNIAIAKDPELNDLKSKLSSTQQELTTAQESGKPTFTRQTTWDEKLKALAQTVEETKKAIDARLRALGAEAELDNTIADEGTDDDALPTDEQEEQPASALKRLRWDNGRLLPVQ